MSAVIVVFDVKKLAVHHSALLALAPALAYHASRP
jgi:hypothetical protein